MNLHNYFTQQSRQYLPDNRKLALYEKICYQRSGFSPSLKRSKILTKKRVYAFLSFVLFFACFGTFFWEDTRLVDYRAFFTQKGFFGLGSVSAAQVAEILEINGEYIIEKEGKQFKNSVLFDGDVIILKENAKIIFNINEHIKAEILGPAKFIITYISEGKYRLSLLEGNFLKLDGNRNVDALEVETEDMAISMTKDEEIALELTKVNNTTQVKNAGAPLLIKNKKTKTEEAPTKLETAKLLTVQDNDIAKITDIETLEEVLSTKNNLTHTVTLAQNTTGQQLLSGGIPSPEEPSILSGDTSFLASNHTEVSSGNQESITSDLAYQSDEKSIPTETQLSQITAALNPNFILGDIQLLYTAKLGENSEAIQGAYRTLLWRLKSIGDAYSIQIKTDTPTSSNFLSELKKLQQGLNKYHLPPAKIQQLEVLKNWAIHLQNLVPTEDWEVYKKTLPANLQFK
ncbi:hypothetical protein BSK20_00645 [SR1 bacterium human oral taxon HOT-345]|nr:hypothetical protein BSK20_00645 [SR1 bacterium human oral taxon HOT-345]